MVQRAVPQTGVAPVTRPFWLQGHRGARGLFPENTLEGFRRAKALGINAFEVDVGMTADNEVVLCHDLTLNPDITRGPDGRWLTRQGPPIWSLRLDELRAYDVGRIRPGSHYAALHPDQQPQDGARIPTLAELLRLDHDFALNIEIKTNPRYPDQTPAAADLAEAVLAVLDREGAASRVMIESFDWRGPRHVRKIRPELRLAWLTREATVRDAALWWGGPEPSDFGGSVPRAVAAEGGSVWAPEHVDLTPELVAEAHDLGLTVLPWTANDPADIGRLLRWGVDGLITDRPDIARPIVAVAKGWPPSVNTY